MITGCTSSKITSTKYSVKQGQSVILGESALDNALDQCSRPTPNSDQNWIPSNKIIKQLETDLPKIMNITTDLCCIYGGSIDDLNNYFRQYIGVVIDGKKYIYINAFHQIYFDLPDYGIEIVDWKNKVVRFCDGGDSFWGVLYNPETRRFSQLAFNGVV